MEYASFDNHTVCGCIDHHGSYRPEGHYVPEDKDHHKSEDRDHYSPGEHHKQEDNDRKSHYSEGEHDHKYPHVAYKDQYPPTVREPVRSGSDDKYESKNDKRTEPGSNNRKIDSLYITI